MLNFFRYIYNLIVPEKPIDEEFLLSIYPPSFDLDEDTNWEHFEETLVDDEYPIERDLMGEHWGENK